MNEHYDSHRHRVVAGILIRNDQVLLCRRSVSRAWYPGVWDLPGGHVECGETPHSALVRELHEELGISIGEPTSESSTHLRGQDFDMEGSRAMDR